MERWNTKLEKNQENKRIDDFIDDVLSVCKKHGFSIKHEDNQGSFIISVFNDEACDWLKDANDET